MAKFCTNCKTEISADEPPGMACPKCGSTNRTIGMTAQADFIEFGVSSATLTAIHLWETLQSTMERLFNADEYGVAVIVAQTACEVVIEQAMQKAFATKNVPELEGPVTDYLVSYSISGERNRKLYTALTGDKIAEQSFWSDYQKLVKMRNDSVHSGAVCDKQATRTALVAAKAFVEHVVKHNRL